MYLRYFLKVSSPTLPRSYDFSNKVGKYFHFPFRNRVAVHLQKNLDRQRLKRIAHKLSSTTAPEVAAERKASTQGSRTGGLLGNLPGQLTNIPRQKSPGEIEAEATGNGDDDDEYEYYEESEEGDASGDK